MPQGRHRRGRCGRGQFAGGAIRRFLEPVLLLLLRRGANHGYDLTSALEPFGLGEVAPGPVYRTLRDLEAAGLVQSEWDVESSEGPARRVYHITQPGRRYLAEWAEELQETDKMLHHFLAAYDRHTQEDEDGYHQA
jgi:PadR family transcriptional regulator PadR